MPVEKVVGRPSEVMLHRSPINPAAAGPRHAAARVHHRGCPVSPVHLLRSRVDRRAGNSLT